MNPFCLFAVVLVFAVFERRYTTPKNNSRWRPPRVSLLQSASFLCFALASGALAQTTERASLSSAGLQGNGNSSAGAISADGRFVAFVSDASNLVQGDIPNVRDVFVRDRLTGSTELVSVTSSGIPANGSSGSPSISADGRYVAFVSGAPNLTGDPLGPGSSDIFVHDRLNGTTELVSTTVDGKRGGSSEGPSISADGRYVAFYSYSSLLVVGDTNAQPDVFVRDRQEGTTDRVSVSSTLAQGNFLSARVPSISADGRYVAFSSLASNLVDDDTNSSEDVFVRDRLAGTTVRASVTSSGSQGNGESSQPSISANGRFVAFLSVATNMAPVGAVRRSNVYVHDLLSGVTTIESVAYDGALGDSGSGYPSISADGRYVAFLSVATNLVPNDTNGTEDMFVRDRLAQITERVSVSNSGQQSDISLGNGYDRNDTPWISAGGRHVAFPSFATNLVIGDTNGLEDIFVRDRLAPRPALTSVSPNSLTVGSDAITVSLRGKAFAPSTMAFINGGARATTFVSATELRVLLRSTDLARAGSLQVVAASPGPGGGTSNSILLAVGPAVRIVASVALQRNGDTITATVRLANTGIGTATGVLVDSGFLAGATPQAALPIVVGALGSGATKVVTLVFPAQGASGTGASFRVGGRYAGGTFDATLRVTLP